MAEGSSLAMFACSAGPDEVPLELDPLEPPHAASTSAGSASAIPARRPARLTVRIILNASSDQEWTEYVFSRAASADHTQCPAGRRLLHAGAANQKLSPHTIRPCRAAPRAPRRTLRVSASAEPAAPRCYQTGAPTAGSSIRKDSVSAD